jgi:hypothetical protein
MKEVCVPTYSLVMRRTDVPPAVLRDARRRSRLRDQTSQGSARLLVLLLQSSGMIESAGWHGRPPVSSRLSIDCFVLRAQQRGAPSRLFSCRGHMLPLLRRGDSAMMTCARRFRPKLVEPTATSQRKHHCNMLNLWLRFGSIGPGDWVVGRQWCPELDTEEQGNVLPRRALFTSCSFFRREISFDTEMRVASKMVKPTSTGSNTTYPPDHRLNSLVIAYCSCSVID